MKRVGGVAAAAAGLAMGLAGCAGEGTSVSTTTVTRTVTETAGTGAANATTSQPPSSASQEVKYGQPVEGDIVKFTVSKVRDVTNPSDQFDDGTWAAMIEICATGDLGGPISPMQHFVLLDDQGATYQPSGSTGGTMPTPQLDPGSVSVPEGKCRKGNLFFSAPAGAKITGAEATDSDGNSMGTWKQ